MKALKPKKPEVGHCKAAGHGSAVTPEMGEPGAHHAPSEYAPVLGVVTGLKALLVEFAAAKV